MFAEHGYRVHAGQATWSIDMPLYKNPKLGAVERVSEVALNRQIQMTWDHRFLAAARISRAESSLSLLDSIVDPPTRYRASDGQGIEDLRTFLAGANHDSKRGRS